MAMPFLRPIRHHNRILTDLQDEELVRLAKTDQAAFGELYARYRQEIERFVRPRVGNNHAHAEDITSQVFTKALSALPRYTEGPFRAWLYRITRNAIIDDYRRKRPDATIDEIAEPFADVDDPLDHAVASDAAARLYAALETLKPGQREILRLRLHGLSIAEIADRLGMTENAIKSAQRRAFLALREHPGVQL